MRKPKQYMTFTSQFEDRFPGWNRMIYPTNGDAAHWAKKAEEAGTFPKPHPDDPYANKDEQK